MTHSQGTPAREFHSPQERTPMTHTNNDKVHNAVWHADADFELRNHYVLMTKTSGRALNHTQATTQIDGIVAGVSTSGRVQRGWTVTWDKSFDRTNDGMTEVSTGIANEMKTTIRLHVECKTLRPEDEFKNLVTALDAKGTLSKWSVVEVDGEGWEPATAGGTTVDGDKTKELIPYANVTIPEDFASRFSKLYGLDAHISRIRRAIEVAVNSGFEKRIHTMLQGPPACGKSHILEIMHDIFGAEAVLKLDGPSTTMAGAQEALKERDVAPRVLFIEEIEKIANTDALTYLLSIMDMRGEVRKVTARGNIIRDAKMIVVCTVNDYEKFKTIASGALASRFANRVFFQRPDREVRKKILIREIDEIGEREDPEAAHEPAHRERKSRPELPWRQARVLCKKLGS